MLFRSDHPRDASIDWHARLRPYLDQHTRLVRDYDVVPSLFVAAMLTLVLADNRLALDAGWDEEMLRVELASLKEEDYDLDLEIDPSLADLIYQEGVIPTQGIRPVLATIQEIVGAQIAGVRECRSNTEHRRSGSEARALSSS